MKWFLILALVGSGGSALHASKISAGKSGLSPREKKATVIAVAGAQDRVQASNASQNKQIELSSDHIIAMENMEYFYQPRSQQNALQNSWFGFMGHLLCNAPELLILSCAGTDWAELLVKRSSGGTLFGYSREKEKQD